MTSPKRLRLGNVFQEIVQAGFIANSKGGGAGREVHIDSGPGSKRSGSKKNKAGRVDIWIDDLANDASGVFEIKATDWDLIAPRNVRRNVYRHQKQPFDYAYKYHWVDNLQVTYGLIYPNPPEKEGLREEIEEVTMTAYDVPAYWYTELNLGFNPLQLSRWPEVHSSESN